jgi:hypothetical protein
LAEAHPEIGAIPELTRTHSEKFLVFNAHRLSRGRRGRGKPISVVHHAHIVIDLRSFFDDTTAWRWNSGRTPLVHRGDVPRKTHPLPGRCLPTPTAH